MEVVKDATNSNRAELKCIHNDEGIWCNDNSCQQKHPTGICIDWRRGVCEQDDQCLYRHPNEEHGTLQSRSSYQNEDEGKRKRTSSPIPAPPMKNMKETQSKDGKTFNNFSFKKMMEMEKRIETKDQASKEESIHTRWLTQPSPSTHLQPRTQPIQLQWNKKQPDFPSPSAVPSFIRQHPSWNPKQFPSSAPYQN